MKDKYFTVEKENNIERKETEEIASYIDEKKYYSVHIEGMPYGSLIRETEDYSEALNLYRQIKRIFNIYECEIVLQKHVTIGDKTEVTVIYSKQIGKEFGIEKHLHDIINSLNKLDKMKKLYTSTNSDCDKFLSAFSHSLEHINAEKLSEEQMRELFRNVEEKGALRRISKSQMDHLMNLQTNLNSMRSNANKALDTYKKTEFNRRTQKAVENKVAKDNEYLSTIGLI